MTHRARSQLALVRGLAQRREQALAREAGTLARQRASAEATLSRLDGYLDEYAAGAGESAAARSRGELENERRFVQRLNRAVEQQRAHARRLTERASQSKTRWQRARSELEALDRLLAERAREQARAEQRREQREIDARGARRAGDHPGPQETTP